MDSGHVEKSPLIALAAVVLTAAGTWFAYSVQPMWWLAWLAPIPVFAYALRAGRLAAFAVAFAAFAIGLGSWWSFLHGRIHAPLPAIVASLAVPALLLALGALVLRAFSRRGRIVAAPFAVATYWCGVMYLVSLASPDGTAGNIGYTQMDFLAAIQIAALGGVHAIGFLIMLFVASVAMLFAPVEPARRRRAAAIGVAVVVAAIAVGAWRMRDVAPATLPVAALASDFDGPNGVPKAGTPDGEALLRRYADAVGAVAQRGAKLVLIPENVVSVDDAHAAAFEALFRDAARTHGVDIVVGAGRFADGPDRNLAYVFKPDGTAPRQYAKRHLVPGLERQFTPGDGARYVDDGATRWGLAICKDYDFPALSREYGNERVGLMLAPAWDFIDDAWLHDRMAVLRGVENGFAVLRAARDGLLTLSDDRGRVLASARSDAAETASIVATAPTLHRPTWYTRIGDAFSIVCVVAFLALSGWLALTARRR